MANILIVDDDQGVCESLSTVFASEGHQVSHSNTLEEGLEAAAVEPLDVVFLDIRMPDGSGLDYLPLFQSTPSRPEVIVMTGFADREGAEEALKGNAWDYIKKPASLKSLTVALENAIQYRNQKVTRDPLLDFNPYGIVGKSDALKNCLRLAAQAASNLANVLITGESGTGKELFARVIHKNSTRTQEPFVVVDCGSLPPTLAESILMGHAKGAYTGAHRSEKGLIKAADRGTLLLDEVGELPFAVQKAFLRVIEERRFRPIGELKEVESDFRLISATNKDLDRLVDEGAFREDLLFRLRSVTICLPPLRERADDIPLLGRRHLDELARRYGSEPKKLSPNFLEVLQAYSWPGNVRELLHTLDAVYAQAQNEPILFARHLPPEIRVAQARSFGRRATEPEVGSEGAYPAEPMAWKDFRRELVDRGEKKYLSDLIVRAEGNVKKAARLSGLSIPRIYELLRKHGISSKYTDS